MPFLVFGTPPHSAATALTRAEKVPSKAQIEFDPGMSPAEAALLARRSEVASCPPAALQGMVCFRPGQAPLLHYLRSDLNAARISVANSSGSSQAAKWPPLAASLK